MMLTVNAFRSPYTIKYSVTHKSPRPTILFTSNPDGLPG